MDSGCDIYYDQRDKATLTFSFETLLLAPRMHTNLFYALHEKKVFRYTAYNLIPAAVQVLTVNKVATCLARK